MKHKTTLIKKTLAAMSDNNEQEILYDWIDKNRSKLKFVSEELGCGCCVSIINIEGEEKIIKTVPKEIFMENIKKVKTKITGKELVAMGFKSGKWFPEAIEYINSNNLSEEERLTYLEQYRSGPEIELLESPADFKINIKAEK